MNDFFNGPKVALSELPPIPSTKAIVPWILGFGIAIYAIFDALILHWYHYFNMECLTSKTVWSSLWMFMLVPIGTYLIANCLRKGQI